MLELLNYNSQKVAGNSWLSKSSLSGGKFSTYPFYMNGFKFTYQGRDLC